MSGVSVNNDVQESGRKVRKPKKSIAVNKEEKQVKPDASLSGEEVSQSMQDLIDRNRQLSEDLARARQTEKFVGIENLSKGRVWLPAPESRSGRKEDANKGRLLKKTGELVLVPVHWMLDYVANRTSCFRWGEVRVNNERARGLNPQLNIVDIDLPEEFILNSMPPSEIVRIAYSGSEGFFKFVDKFNDRPYVLSRAQGILNDEIKKHPAESSAYILLLSFVDHIDEVLNPELPETKEG